MNSRVLCLTGPVAIIAAWLVIFVSAHLNPWFSIWVNAFSDLGGPRALYPWVYNYGMMLVGSMVALFGSCLVVRGLDKLQDVGGSFFIIAGIFLVLIGLFHEGTYPHVFVSKWFFVQADLSAFTWGMGSLASGLRRTGAAELMISLAGPVGALAVRWQSGALIEAYGIVLIDVFAALAFFDATRSLTRHYSRQPQGTSL
ncbi:MAG: DUF998 domain-containing protein [Acidilobus sp.]